MLLWEKITLWKYFRWENFTCQCYFVL